MTETLVIGAGEVGSSIAQIVNADIRDIEDNFVRTTDKYKVLHICYPDHEGFDETTKKYIKEYAPEFTIIHSSVSIGTTRQCGNDVVYCPIRGRHPRNGLGKEIPRFNLFVASSDYYTAKKAADYLRKAGLPLVGVFDKPETLEALKLISNVHMGLEVAWRQEIERLLNYFSIHPQYYEIWEKTYQSGCKENGDDHLVRPLMEPHPIGGHCILPCTGILKKQFPSKLFDFILESNQEALLGK